MPDDLRVGLAQIAGCFLGFFVVFALVGTSLSHYLFIWADSASNAAFSETLLWVIYLAFAVIMGLLVFFTRPHPVECLIIGALMSISAGGFYCIGYVNVAIVVAVAAVVAVVVLLLRLGPVRAGYIAISAGLCFSLGSFAYSAVSVARVADLSYVGTSGSTVTATAWATMSTSQREGFITSVIQKEVSRLALGSVLAYQAVLPKDVIATVGSDGSLLVNYAVLRVESPSVDKVASYEQTNGTPWVYEALTSPDDIVKGTVHGMAHIYQAKRVAGEISEQRTWPYDDANADDGSNAALSSWEKDLPVDPASDKQSYGNLLESQAWGYASNRLSAYVE